jgi:hypothetical protein
MLNKYDYKRYAADRKREKINSIHKIMINFMNCNNDIILVK